MPNRGRDTQGLPCYNNTFSVRPCSVSWWAIYLVLVRYTTSFAPHTKRQPPTPPPQQQQQQQRESFYPPMIPGRNCWKKNDQDHDNSWNNYARPKRTIRIPEHVGGRALLQQEYCDNNNDKDHEVQVLVLGYFLTLVLCCGSSVSLSSSWCRRHSRHCPTAVPRRNTTRVPPCQSTWEAGPATSKSLVCRHCCQIHPALGTGRDSPLAITGWLVFGWTKVQLGVTSCFVMCL